MRVLAICIAVAVVIFVLTGGRFVFLPLVLLPFGVFSFGGRRRR